jgi:PAS domain S-box-containing protein
MNEPIRILIVEDLPTDADLAMREIRRSLADCEFQRVETEPTFLEALEKFNPDLVLSDYYLPRFTGMEALRLVKEHTSKTPLIIYTGPQNEDTAVACMKAGAADYIIKENIKRLGSAVIHALEEKKARIEHQQAQEALRLNSVMMENVAAGIYLVRASDGVILHTNPRFNKLFGYSIDELVGKHVSTLNAPTDRTPQEVAKEIIEALNKNKVWEGDVNCIRKDGVQFWCHANIATFEHTQYGTVWVASRQDITERKLAEEEINNQLQRLSALRTIDQVITSSLDLHVTLNVLLEHVITRLNVDAAVVLLLDHNLNELEYATGRGFRSKNIPRLHLKLGEGYAGEVALKRRTISIANLAVADPPFSKAWAIAGEDFVSYFAIPLFAKGQVNGVLEIFHRTGLNPTLEWLDYLETLAGQAAIAIDSGQLFEGLQKANTELILAYEATIEGWSRAMDLRDQETEGHTQRVTALTMNLVKAAGVSKDQIVHIRRGALLHDIGKLGVPDNILLKPGTLTDQEWVIMRKHPQYAFDLLSSIEYLRLAMDIPYCHHERWDGTGYPRGLKGEQIPFAARLFAVVDVWDALRSDRPYRESWPEKKVLQHIRAEAGTHFDPKAVELFFRMLSENTEEPDVDMS